MNRAFIAVRIPPLPGLLQALGQLREMGRALKPVAPDNLHITLRFLGYVEGHALASVTEALRQAAADVAPLMLTVQGVGLFPDLARPTTVWAGSRGQEPLVPAVEHLGRLLAGLGFPEEAHPWVCHTTLARIKARPPASLRAFLDHYRNANFGVVRVEALDLMLSDLTPAGPVYTVAQSVPLG